ncbi:MAG: hypothetical protein ACJAWV_002743 [Flammeovirgaceae bacterium]|jgi:hypothetical protein
MKKTMEITSPRKNNSIFKTRLVGKFWSGGSHFVGPAGNIPFLLSEIRISRRSDAGIYRGSDGVYATTIHELTHAGHYRMDRAFFLNLNNLVGADINARKVMRESWPEGVETVVTNRRYGLLSSVYVASNALGNTGWRALWNSGRQDDLPENMNEYTPLIIDLVDGINQRVAVGNIGVPIDRVSGYTLNQIETSLNNSRSLVEFRDKLRDQHNNPTEQFLDDLFSYATTASANLRTK